MNTSGSGRAAGMVLLAALSGAACRRPQSAPVLFECQLSAAALAKISGSSISSRRIAERGQVTALDRTRRYPFVVLRDHTLMVATDTSAGDSADAALAGGAPVLTAGGLTVLDRGTGERLVLDAQSAAYCATDDSLGHAVSLLAGLSFPPETISVRSRPRRCASDPPPQDPRDYADIMVEIDRRFRMAREAISRRDVEGADYYLFALLTSVSEDLPRARPSERTRGLDLTPYVQRFVRTDFPPLRQAVWDGDWNQARERAAATAASCNACHVAANLGFIQVR